MNNPSHDTARIVSPAQFKADVELMSKNPNLNSKAFDQMLDRAMKVAEHKKGNWAKDTNPAHEPVDKFPDNQRRDGKTWVAAVKPDMVTPTRT